MEWCQRFSCNHLRGIRTLAYDSVNGWPGLTEQQRRVCIGIARKWARRYPALADDIFQECKLAAWLAVKTHVPSLGEIGPRINSHVSWSARNVVGEWRFQRYSDHRRRIARKEVQGELALEMAASPPDDINVIAGGVWQKLTGRHALYLHLKVVCDLSYADIAALEGVSKSTVVGVVHIAKLRARRIMRQEALDERTGNA